MSDELLPWELKLLDEAYENEMTAQSEAFAAYFSKEHDEPYWEYESLLISRAIAWANHERWAQEFLDSRNTMTADELIESFRAEDALTENELQIVEEQIREWGAPPENLIQAHDWALKWDNLVHRVETVIAQRKGEK
jgi:hypothetical protein